MNIYRKVMITFRCSISTIRIPQSFKEFSERKRKSMMGPLNNELKFDRSSIKFIIKDHHYAEDDLNYYQLPLTIKYKFNQINSSNVCIGQENVKRK